MSLITLRDAKGRIEKATGSKRNWHKDRFVFREGCIELKCPICGKLYYLPPSKAKHQNIRCSIECNRIHLKQQKELRKANCLVCNKEFYPRKTQINSGCGKYCSQKCHGIAVQGSYHPQWVAGRKESYRKSYTKRLELIRNGSQITKKMINELGYKQKWKCAICKTNIKNSFHKDHIVPLAKNGVHNISNIQLLCKICNCSKQAKDPIEYMQSIGYLL